MNFWKPRAKRKENVTDEVAVGESQTPEVALIETSEAAPEQVSVAEATVAAAEPEVAELTDIVTTTAAVDVSASRSASSSDAPKRRIITDVKQPVSERAAKREIERAIRAAKSSRTKTSSSKGAPKRSKRRAGQRLAAISTLLAFTGFGAAVALPNLGTDDAVASGALEAQPAIVLSSANSQSISLSDYKMADTISAARDSYTSKAPPVVRYVARWSGYSGGYVNDPNAKIQWPFSTSVPISSHYGPRWGTIHTGTDFDAGPGHPEQSIADGLVMAVGWNIKNGCGYGVMIDHGTIDGNQVSTLYCHMMNDSSPVEKGQTITVGTVVGRVGSTGWVTGPHLHLELFLNGNMTNPYVWLQNHAGK